MLVEKLYCCVQQTYLEEDAQKYKPRYVALLAQAISECPEGRTDLRIADQLVKEGRHYQALRALRKLIGQKAFGERRKQGLGLGRFRRHRVRCFMEQEVRHGEKAVYARVQA